MPNPIQLGELRFDLDRLVRIQRSDSGGEIFLIFDCPVQANLNPQSMEARIIELCGKRAKVFLTWYDALANDGYNPTRWLAGKGLKFVSLEGE